jgi:hypothetical protein
MKQCTSCGRRITLWNRVSGTEKCDDCYEREWQSGGQEVQNSPGNEAETISTPVSPREGTPASPDSLHNNSERYPIASSKPLPSLSGWLATLLGIYLIGTGVFNVAKLSQGGTADSDQSSQIIGQAGVDPNVYPVAIVVSYVVGAPLFLGSALLALGSIARSAKRSRM